MNDESDRFPGSISDLETDLEDAIAALVDYERRGELPPDLRPLLTLTPPDGASVHVSLRNRDSLHQLRRTLDEKSFDPRTCGAWIVFELAPQHPVNGDQVADADYMREFVVALDRAERDPHMSFVALKFFRDQYLTKTGHGWARDFDLVRHVMQQVTEREIIALSRVPNPRQPEFPVTSIHLNREHPLVIEWLGGPTENAGETTATPEQVSP